MATTFTFFCSGVPRAPHHMVTHRCDEIWFHSHDVMTVRTYVCTSVPPSMYANVTSIMLVYSIHL